MRNNFASQLLFFFIRVLLFWNSVVSQIQCSAQQFWAVGWGGGVGSALRLGNDLLSTVKVGFGVGICKAREVRGDFVNCTLLDLFFVRFTLVQICSLKLPPRFFVICSVSGTL
jgi:hypothetical protein